jgi:hypothetical protein
MHWFFFLALVGCASQSQNPPVLATDKEFAVPTVLANQFAVHEEGSTSAVVSQAPAIPVAEPAKPEKSKKGARHSKKEIKTMKTEAKAVPNRWNISPMFRTGEHTVFDITYFGATAGQLQIDILPTKIVSERPTFHFRASASTSSVFSLFYRLNDVAESFMDTEGLFSHKYSLKLDESKQIRDVLELYDHKKKKAYYWSKLQHVDKGIKNDQSEIEMTTPFAQDGLSAFQYVRTLPLEVGKVYEFPVLNNGKLRTVRVTVIRKEDLKTKIGEFPAIVVKPEVVLDGVLSSYGDSFIWISDDPERAILKMDAKIKVGSVIAYLREHSYGEKTASSP